MAKKITLDDAEHILSIMGIPPMDQNQLKKIAEVSIESTDLQFKEFIQITHSQRLKDHLRNNGVPLVEDRIHSIEFAANLFISGQYTIEMIEKAVNVFTQYQDKGGQVSLRDKDGINKLLGVCRRGIETKPFESYLQTLRPPLPQNISLSHFLNILEFAKPTVNQTPISQVIPGAKDEESNNVLVHLPKTVGRFQQAQKSSLISESQNRLYSQYNKQSLRNASPPISTTPHNQISNTNIIHTNDNYLLPSGSYMQSIRLTSPQNNQQINTKSSPPQYNQRSSPQINQRSSPSQQQLQQQQQQQFHIASHEPDDRPEAKLFRMHLHPPLSEREKIDDSYKALTSNSTFFLSKFEDLYKLSMKTDEERENERMKRQQEADKQRKQQEEKLKNQEEQKKFEKKILMPEIQFDNEDEEEESPQHGNQQISRRVSKKSLKSKYHFPPPKELERDMEGRVVIRDAKGKLDVREFTIFPTAGLLYNVAAITQGEDCPAAKGSQPRSRIIDVQNAINKRAKKLNASGEQEQDDEQQEEQQPNEQSDESEGNKQHNSFLDRMKLPAHVRLYPGIPKRKPSNYHPSRSANKGIKPYIYADPNVTYGLPRTSQQVVLEQRHGFIPNHDMLKRATFPHQIPAVPSHLLVEDDRRTMNPLDHYHLVRPSPDGAQSEVLITATETIPLIPPPFFPAEPKDSVAFRNMQSNDIKESLFVVRKEADEVQNRLKWMEQQKKLQIEQEKRRKLIERAQQLSWKPAAQIAKEKKNKESLTKEKNTQENTSRSSKVDSDRQSDFDNNRSTSKLQIQSDKQQSSTQSLIPPARGFSPRQSEYINPPSFSMHFNPYAPLTAAQKFQMLKYKKAIQNQKAANKLQQDIIFFNDDLKGRYLREVMKQRRQQQNMERGRLRTKSQQEKEALEKEQGKEQEIEDEGITSTKNMKTEVSKDLIEKIFPSQQAAQILMRQNELTTTPQSQQQSNALQSNISISTSSRMNNGIITPDEDEEDKIWRKKMEKRRRRKKRIRKLRRMKEKQIQLQREKELESMREAERVRLREKQKKREEKEAQLELERKLLAEQEEKDRIKFEEEQQKRKIESAIFDIEEGEVGPQSTLYGAIVRVYPQQVEDKINRTQSPQQQQQSPGFHLHNSQGKPVEAFNPTQSNQGITQQGKIRKVKIQSNNGEIQQHPIFYQLEPLSVTSRVLNTNGVGQTTVGSGSPSERGNQGYYTDQQSTSSTVETFPQYNIPIRIDLENMHIDKYIKYADRSIYSKQPADGGPPLPTHPQASQEPSEIRLSQPVDHSRHESQKRQNKSNEGSEEDKNQSLDDEDEDDDDLDSDSWDDFSDDDEDDDEDDETDISDGNQNDFNGKRNQKVPEIWHSKKFEDVFRTHIEAQNLYNEHYEKRKSRFELLRSQLMNQFDTQPTDIRNQTSKEGKQKEPDEKQNDDKKKHLHHHRHLDNNKEPENERNIIESTFKSKISNKDTNRASNVTSVSQRSVVLNDVNDYITQFITNGKRPEIDSKDKNKKQFEEKNEIDQNSINDDKNKKKKKSNQNGIISVNNTTGSDQSSQQSDDESSKSSYTLNNSIESIHLNNLENDEQKKVLVVEDEDPLEGRKPKRPVSSDRNTNMTPNYSEQNRTDLLDTQKTPASYAQLNANDSQILSIRAKTGKLYSPAIYNKNMLSLFGLHKQV
ncbi:MAG: hypothetical protein EZS28_011797 [Streblomastix strix]|uniref:Uncharacterized protein n=1 Tax=Streblomastix strix TaxID=222440 RepID=A0A5J4WCL5_9EUKA|nr:MAG: hypothetical protein EZS28_011797 [Streblomastix strix]